MNGEDVGGARSDGFVYAVVWAHSPHYRIGNVVGRFLFYKSKIPYV